MAYVNFIWGIRDARQSLADVAIVDIPKKLEKSQKVAEEIAKRYGVKTIVVGTDVSSKESVDHMVKEVFWYD